MRNCYDREVVGGVDGVGVPAGNTLTAWFRVSIPHGYSEYYSKYTALYFDYHVADESRTRFV